MATKKPTTQSRLAALEAMLQGVDDAALNDDPLVARQRQLMADRAAAEERARNRDVFSATTSSVDSTAELAPERGWVGQRLDDSLNFAGATIDAVQGGLQRSASNALFTQGDYADPNPVIDRLTSAAGGLVNAFNDASAGIAPDILDVGRRAGSGTLSREGIVRDSAKLADAAEANRTNVDAARKMLENRSFLIAEGGEAVLDAAESPTGALSLIGGPLAAAGMGDSFANEYTKARKEGLSKEEAARSAEMQALPEAIGFIPAGKLLGRVPGISALGRAAENKLNSVLTRTVAQAGFTALGEGTGEAATTVAQLAMHKLNSEFSDSEAMKAYAAKEAPKTAGELGEQVWRSFKAGAVMGAPAGALEGRFKGAADAGAMVANFNTAMDDAITDSNNTRVNQQRVDQARQAAPAPAAPAQTELFPTAQSDGRTFEEQEASRQDSYLRDAQGQLDRRRVFEQVEADRNAQEATERDDMFRQMELDRSAAENPGSPLAQELARVGAQVPRVQPDATVPASSVAAPSTPAADPVQGELNVTTPQPRDIARQEITNVLTKESKKALDAAKSKRAADRRKFREQQLKDTENLSGEERINTVADRMVDWDRSNPVPTAESLAPATTTTASTPAPAAVATNVRETTTAPVKVDYDAIDNAPDEVDVQGQIDAMREFYPNENDSELRQRLALESGQPVPVDSMTSRAENFEPSTLEDVRKVIGQGIGRDSASNTAAAMIGNKRVRLIDGDAQRPADADSRGAAFYDGDGITIDVRSLNKNNIKGDLLLLMAHEGKHAADFSGAGKAGIESFIGKEANDRMIKQIEDAAAKGDGTASRAVAAARDASGGNATLYSIELPAYYINSTRGTARGGLSGALARQVLSPIRVAAKRQLGIDNVNLDDVHYLTDRLVQNLATSNESLAGNINAPMPSIYNESSAGFQQAEAEGRTYTSLDGKRKYVLSDADSNMKTNGYQRLREATDPIPLGDLLDHKVLFREHPEAANIPVIAVDSLGGTTRAEWNDTEQAIYIAKDQMRKVSPRQSLMHEVQHYIQSQGGQASNFFTTHNDKSMAAAKGRASTALQENDRAARLLLDRGSDLRKAAPSAQEFDTVLYDMNRPEWQRAADIAKMVDRSKLSEQGLNAVDRYEATRAAANEASTSYNGKVDTQLGNYFRNITEREAHYTEGNLDVPQSELPLNPETSAMRTPRESLTREGVDITDGQIDVPNVLASRAPLATMPISQQITVTPGAGTKGMDSRFWNAVKGAYDYTGGLGKDFDDMLQNSVGQAAHSAMMAQRNMHDVDKGLAEMADRLNKTRPDIRNKADALKLTKETVFKKMEALEKIPDPKRRENALAVYVRDNPELRPLMRAYADITQMSNDLADVLAASKVTPTKADLEFIQKIRDSGFGYMTRVYQTQTGDAGRRIARQFLKQNAAAQKRMDAGKNLTEKQVEAVKIYTEAADYLMKKMTIPSNQAMQEMRTPLLNDLFNTWTPHDVDAWRENAMAEASARGYDDKAARAHVKDTMINILDERRGMVTTANLNAKAAATIRELLGVGGKPGAIAQRVGGLRQDRGILQKREDMAPQIEKLLGRITTEPSVVLANTLAKQGELLARTKLLLDLKDSGLVVDKDVANTAGMEKFSHQLSGETAGPLDGSYTTPQIANVINSSLEMYSSATDTMAAAFANSAAAADSIWRKTGDFISAGAGIAKLSSIVFDAYNLGLNFAGSPVMLAMNGVYSPMTAMSGLNAGKDSVMNIFTEGGTKWNQLLADGIKYQVVDSARAQELRSSTHQALKEKIVGGWPVAAPAWHNLKKAKQGAVETFSMSDAWVKLAAFKDRVDFLTDYYKAEGINRTAEEIAVEAGNTVRDTNITYGKTPPVLRMGEKYGITTFMPYFYNVPRMMVKSSLQGYADVIMGVQAKNPKAKQLAITKGIGRLAGNAGAIAAMTLGIKAAAEAFNSDDEDEVNEMKKMLRDDVRFTDPLYLGKNAEGMPLFFRTSRIDPMGPVNDLLRVAMDDSIDTDEKVSIIRKQAQGMLFANRFVAAAVGTVLGSEQSKAPMRIERVPVLKDASGAFKDVVGHNNMTRGILAAADSVLPGWLDAADPNNPSLADGSEAGDVAELIATLTKVSGGRVDKGDPSATLRGMAFEMKEVKDAARLEVADRVFRGANPDGTAQAIKKVNKDLYDRMSRMTDVYEGMVEGMGYSPSKAMEVLKEAGGLNSIQIANVRRGLPKDDPELVDKVGGVLSKKSLTEAGKRLQRGQGDVAQAEYDRNAKATIKLLNDKYGMKAGE